MNGFRNNLLCSLLALAGSGCASSNANNARPFPTEKTVSIATVPAGATVTAHYYVRGTAPGQAGSGVNQDLGVTPLAQATLNIPDNTGTVQIFAGSGKMIAYTESYSTGAAIPGQITINLYDSYRYFVSGNATTVRDIAKNTAKWNGLLVSFAGEVTGMNEQRTGTIFQVAVGEGSLLACWPGATMPGVVEGSAVTFLGRVTGETTGKNTAGGNTTSVIFNAIAYIYRGQAHWLTADEATYQKWADGRLCNELKSP
jgi:hypothetical protein